MDCLKCIVHNLLKPVNVFMFASIGCVPLLHGGVPSACTSVCTIGLAMIPTITRSVSTYVQSRDDAPVWIKEYLLYGEMLTNIYVYKSLARHFNTLVLASQSSSSVDLYYLLTLNYRINAWIAKSGYYWFSIVTMYGIILNIGFKVFIYWLYRVLNNSRIAQWVRDTPTSPRLEEAFNTFTQNVLDGRQHFNIHLPYGIDLVCNSITPDLLTPDELDRKCPLISAKTRAMDTDLTVKYLQLKASGNAQCSVCLGDCDPNQLLRLLPCNHLYHCECIDSWLARRSSCPTCRATI